MLQTIPAFPAPTATPHVELVTVGIEPFPRSMRFTGPAYFRNARVAVVVRVDTSAEILCTDNDPERHAALEDVARACATAYEAMLLAARWPVCVVCDRPQCPDLSGCPDPEGHRFSVAASETSWRSVASGPVTVDNDDLTVWAVR